MRFRKSTKIAPGVKINLSKSGVSTTIGGKGLSTNIGSRGAYLNTGIPGTGVSTRHKIVGADNSTKESPNPEIIPVGKTGGRILLIIGIIFIISALVLLISGHPVWAFLSVSMGVGLFIAMILGRAAAQEAESTR
ncbi:MAG: DUF4236 domain-containing protein [Helicobacteraceae bacterium]|nr:DUF4236 domain-containing protein [Helicobacteraceae bacterium]